MVIFDHFLLLDFAKKSIFENQLIFFQIRKVEHTSFPVMYHLSYLEIKHGISIAPPPHPAYPG